MKANTTQVRINNDKYEAIKAYAAENDLSATQMIDTMLDVALIQARRHPGRSKEESGAILQRMKERRKLANARKAKS